MKTYLLERPGLPPLKIEGELAGEATRSVDKRYYHVRLFTVGGISNQKEVIAVTFQSDWERESEFHWVAAGSTSEVGEQIPGWDVVPAGVGFPTGERYTEKQDRLVKQLKAAFALAISDAYKDAGLFDEF